MYDSNLGAVKVSGTIRIFFVTIYSTGPNVLGHPGIKESKHCNMSIQFQKKKV